LIKPEVLGGIYRIRKKGMPKVEDPRGLKIDWVKLTAKQLGNLLGDPRPAVQKRAIATLAGYVDALAILETIPLGTHSVTTRRNAVWTATRINQPKARGVVRMYLADADETVRQAALHSISLWRDAKAVPALIPMLKSPSLHNRRAAAEALGRIGSIASIPALLEALGEPTDRMLEHSLTYALIEIGSPLKTSVGLYSKNSLIKRAALTALDQMQQPTLPLDSAFVINEMGAADPKLQETAWWIAGRHPEWGKALESSLKKRLKSSQFTTAEVQMLAQLAKNKAIQNMLASLLLSSKGVEQRKVVLQAMAKSGLKEAPPAWIEAITVDLEDATAAMLPDTVVAARALRYPKQGAEKLFATLHTVGERESLPAVVRLNALAAISTGLAKVEPKLFTFLCEQVKSDQPVTNRSLAADVLSRAKLSTEQLTALAASLKTAGPMEADRLLEAFLQSTNNQVGQALLDAVKASPFKTSLRMDKLKSSLAKYGPAVQKQGAELLTSLKADAAAQKAKLMELLPLVKTGSVHKGQLVFNSQKAACMTCHSIGYVGGKIGPDLTRIGSIRTELDLLESIVYPSASFVRSFEPVTVSTTAGKVYNGIVAKESASDITLTLNADQQVTIPREEIEDMLPSKVSIMPAGLDKLLSPQELADLVAFLKACK
jgi:putative heme-binding domain-containing protein